MGALPQGGAECIDLKECLASAALDRQVEEQMAMHDFRLPACFSRAHAPVNTMPRRCSHDNPGKYLIKGGGNGTLSIWSQQNLAQDQVLHPIDLCGIGTDRDRKTGALRALLAHKDSAGLCYAGVAFIALAGDERTRFFAELERLATSWAAFKSSRLTDVK